MILIAEIFVISITLHVANAPILVEKEDKCVGVNERYLMRIIHNHTYRQDRLANIYSRIMGTPFRIKFKLNQTMKNNLHISG